MFPNTLDDVIEEMEELLAANPPSMYEIPWDVLRSFPPEARDLFYERRKWANRVRRWHSVLVNEMLFNALSEEEE